MKGIWMWVMLDGEVAWLSDIDYKNNVFIIHDERWQQDLHSRISFLFSLPFPEVMVESIPGCKFASKNDKDYHQIFSFKDTGNHSR